MNIALVDRSWTGCGHVLKSLSIPGILEQQRNKKAGTMAEVIFNRMIKEIRGTLDGVVYRTSASGKTYVSKSPDMSKVKWSKAQKGHRERFKEAGEYAKAAMANPKVRRIYEKRAAKEKRVPYRVALSDYFKGKNLLKK